MILPKVTNNAGVSPEFVAELSVESGGAWLSLGQGKVANASW
jgi:hypothetical protein